jgi:hypothetical protein
MSFLGSRMMFFIKLFFPSLFCLLLMGCVNFNESLIKYEPKVIDSSKGIIIGTIFERTREQPLGVFFYIKTESNETISLHNGVLSKDFTIDNKSPTNPIGVGKPFALQLSPGKYRVDSWILNMEKFTHKKSLKNSIPIEFDVVAGRVSYIGRFDVDRLYEVAAIHDNYYEDLNYIQAHYILKGTTIYNDSLNVRGWWVKNPLGQELMRSNFLDSSSCQLC